MVIVKRTSKTPEAAIDVRINLEVTVPAKLAGDRPSTRIETVCRAFLPGEVHTLEDDVAARLEGDAGLAAHFTFEHVAAAEVAAPAPASKKRS